jgi:DNA repair exonuclease SbcCD nuclease subunit
MKIGFIADIHIKLGQKNVPVEWAKNRFKEMMEQISEYNDSVDMWVIGGDIFDRAPTVEEMEVYFDLIDVFKKRTLVYAGNHEALKKNTTFLTYLKRCTKRMNPLVEIIDDFYTDIASGIDVIPYNKLKEYHPSDINFHGRILCTHVRGEIPPHVKPEVPLELFERWDVVLAGDLHSYDNCQRNILYPGSPITTSFHRHSVDTGFIILDSDTLTHTWHKFDLPQLIRKTISPGETPIPGLRDHVMYEVEGDISELGVMEDNALIDKKIVRRSTDTTLILEPDMSLEQEVTEYLSYVLELNESTVEAVIKELSNHANKLTT